MIVSFFLLFPRYFLTRVLSFLLRYKKQYLLIQFHCGVLRNNNCKRNLRHLQGTKIPQILQQHSLVNLTTNFEDLRQNSGCSAKPLSDIMDVKPNLHDRLNKKSKMSPWWDSNLRSSAWEAGVLPIVLWKPDAAPRQKGRVWE